MIKAARAVSDRVNYTITEDFENANRAVAHSIFMQDQWTRGRMTLQGALRWDYVYSWAPAEGNGTDQTSRFTSDADPVSAHGERDGLSRPQSARWSRVRSLRQREDRSEGQRRPLPVSGDCRRCLLLAEPGRKLRPDGHQPCVDRLERQFRRRLQPAESSRAGHQRDRRRRLRRAHRREPELRQHRSEYDQSRPGAF